MAVLGVLPSPDDLRGEPAAVADPAQLQDALTGARDPKVTARIAELDPPATGVRRWSASGGRRLIAVVSVWDSHLTAIGIGGDMATALAAAFGPEAPAPVVTGQYRLGDVRHVVGSARLAEEAIGFRAEVPFAEGVRRFATDPLRAAAGPG